jgi:hypothetical protein
VTIIGMVSTSLKVIVAALLVKLVVSAVLISVYFCIMKWLGVL